MALVARPDLAVGPGDRRHIWWRAWTRWWNGLTRQQQELLARANELGGWGQLQRVAGNIGGRFTAFLRDHWPDVQPVLPEGALMEHEGPAGQLVRQGGEALAMAPVVVGGAGAIAAFGELMRMTDRAADNRALEVAGQAAMDRQLANAAENRLAERQPRGLERVQNDRYNREHERAQRPRRMGGKPRVLKHNSFQLPYQSYNRTHGSGIWETNIINYDGSYGAQYTALWLPIAVQGTGAYNRRGNRVNVRAWTLAINLHWERVGAASAVAPDEIVDNPYFDYYIIHDTTHIPGQSDIDLSKWDFEENPARRMIIDASGDGFYKYKILKQGRLDAKDRKIMRGGASTAWTFPWNDAWEVKLPLGAAGLDHSWPQTVTGSGSELGSGASIFVLIRACDELVNAASTNENNGQWNVHVYQRCTYIDYSN